MKDIKAPQGIHTKNHEQDFRRDTALLSGRLHDALVDCDSCTLRRKIVEQILKILDPSSSHTDQNLSATQAPGSRSRWMQLPLEIQGRIFSHLPLDEISRTQAISRYHRTTYLQTISNLQSSDDHLGYIALHPEHAKKILDAEQYQLFRKLISTIRDSHVSRQRHQEVADMIMNNDHHFPALVDAAEGNREITGTLLDHWSHMPEQARLKTKDLVLKNPDRRDRLSAAFLKREYLFARIHPIQHHAAALIELITNEETPRQDLLVIAQHPYLHQSVFESLALKAGADDQELRQLLLANVGIAPPTLSVLLEHARPQETFQIFAHPRASENLRENILENTSAEVRLAWAADPQISQLGLMTIAKSAHPEDTSLRAAIHQNPNINDTILAKLLAQALLTEQDLLLSHVSIGPKSLRIFAERATASQHFALLKQQNIPPRVIEIIANRTPSSDTPLREAILNHPEVNDLALVALLKSATPQEEQLIRSHPHAGEFLAVEYHQLDRARATTTSSRHLYVLACSAESDNTLLRDAIRENPNTDEKTLIALVRRAQPAEQAILRTHPKIGPQMALELSDLARAQDPTIDLASLQKLAQGSSRLHIALRRAIQENPVGEYGNLITFDGQEAAIPR